ncbi:MAG: hypothetical protein ACOCRO_03815 [Halanaerobiales bacterium]
MIFADIMTKTPIKLNIVEKNDKILDCEIEKIPVINNKNKFLGLISKNKLLKKYFLEKNYNKNLNLNDLIMNTKNVVLESEEINSLKTLKTFSEDLLVVTNDNKFFKGIISPAKIAKYFYNLSLELISQELV